MIPVLFWCNCTALALRQMVASQSATFLVLLIANRSLVSAQTHPEQTSLTLTPTGRTATVQDHSERVSCARALFSAIKSHQCSVTRIRNYNQTISVLIGFLMFHFFNDTTGIFWFLISPGHPIIAQVAMSCFSPLLLMLYVIVIRLSYQVSMTQQWETGRLTGKFLSRVFT